MKPLRRLPSERLEHADRLTGRRVWQLTAAPACSSHLYFYSEYLHPRPVFSPDDRFVLFSSDRGTGFSQLFLVAR